MKIKKLFKKKKKNIFMDYASGTPIAREVLSKMYPFFSQKFYNPGAIYEEGFKIKRLLQKLRKQIAGDISALPQEIIFTDGGTEANNLVLRGIVSWWRRKYQTLPHIITSQAEHASILETCDFLAQNNLAEITYLEVDENGLIDSKKLKSAIHDNTVLVSLHYVNGETGVLQDLRAFAKTIRHYRKRNKTVFPYFHSDVIQSVNYYDISVHTLGLDFMTLNASKIYGPKKTAFLYKKKNIVLDPLITGGSQEFSLRAGTENIPYLIGFAEALHLSKKIQKTEYTRVLALREMAEKLFKEKLILDFIINGEDAPRAPHILNISLHNLSHEEIVLRLGAQGVKVSMKSACKSGAYGDSHVLLAMRDKYTQSIRFSFGRDTTKKDIIDMIKSLTMITGDMQKTFDKYIK